MRSTTRDGRRRHRHRLRRVADWRTCGYCGVARPARRAYPLRDLRRYREEGEAICARYAGIATDPRIPLPDIGWGAFDHAVWRTPAQRVRSRRSYVRSRRSYVPSRRSYVPSRRSYVPYWRTENAASRDRDRATLRRWERARRRRLGWPLDPPRARPEPPLYNT